MSSEDIAVIPMETAASDHEVCSFLKEPTPSHLRLGSSNMPSPAPVVKETRKRLRSSSLMSSEALKRIEKLRSDLHDTAHAILDQKPLSVSYSSVFKSVEMLCVYKHSEQSRLADFIFQAIDERISSWELPYLQTEESNGVEFQVVILKFVDDFESWAKRLELLEQLFLFVDRSYLLHHPKKKTILEYGMNRFASRFIYQKSDDTSVLTEIQALLKRVHFESRHSLAQDDVSFAGQNESQLLFSKFLAIVLRLDYQLSFSSEAGLAAIITANYKLLKNVWLEDSGSYLVVVLDTLAKESQSLIACGLSQERVESILRTLKWNLIFADYESVLQMSLPNILKQNHYDHLKAIWKLSEIAMLESAFDACRSFTYIWGRIVQSQTQAIVDDFEAQTQKLIPNLFCFWSKIDGIVLECFNTETIVFETRSALGKALGSKKSSSLVISQLSKYCDSFFKQIRKSKERDLYPQFEAEVLSVFKLLPNKTDFVMLYERDLSKRMLMGKTFNFSIENKLLKSILAVVGEGDETSNLVAMFRDMETSKELYGLVQLDCLKQVEFNALVLEKKFWPDIPNPIASIAIPDILGKALDEFTSTYHGQSEKQKFHKLDWSNYLLHQIVLSVSFASGPKELSVNLLQASILIQFEAHDKISFADLLERTKMNPKHLRKVLASLSTERYPILVLKDSGVEFNFEAEIKLNKARIPMVRERETEVSDEASEVYHKSVNPCVRAAIVRVMKQDKQMMFPELLSQVLKRIEASLVAIVKENIEYLISNEYIKREADGVTMTYIP